MSLNDAGIALDAERPERFRSGRFVPGAALGAKDAGTTLDELPPGQAVSPYHYEYTVEEWVLVLEGRPTLRTPSDKVSVCTGVQDERWTLLRSTPRIDYFHGEA